jgi:hypothetical protein
MTETNAVDMMWDYRGISLQPPMIKCRLSGAMRRGQIMQMWSIRRRMDLVFDGRNYKDQSQLPNPHPYQSEIDSNPYNSTASSRFIQRGR